MPRGQELVQMQLTLDDLTQEARHKAIVQGLASPDESLKPLATIRGAREIESSKSLEKEMSHQECFASLKVWMHGQEYKTIDSSIKFKTEFLGQDWFDRLYTYSTVIEVSNFGSRPKYRVDLVLEGGIVARTLYMRNKNLYTTGL